MLTVTGNVDGNSWWRLIVPQLRIIKALACKTVWFVSRSIHVLGKSRLAGKSNRNYQHDPLHATERWLSRPRPRSFSYFLRSHALSGLQWAAGIGTHNEVVTVAAHGVHILVGNSGQFPVFWLKPWLNKSRCPWHKSSVQPSDADSVPLHLAKAVCKSHYSCYV